MKYYSRHESAARLADRAALPAGLDTLRFRGKVPRVSADRLLSLAAAPTFASMALVTGVLGSADMLCSSASPLNGMVLMYLLMAAFHLAPWLRLLSSGRS